MDFNYQAIFKINDKTQLVFVGTTSLTPGNLYLALANQVDKLTERPDAKCFNFIYHPIKENQNETQTQK